MREKSIVLTGGAFGRVHLDTVLSLRQKRPEIVILQAAGSVSPSPRFAESAQQNGERIPPKFSRIEPLNRLRSSASILPIRGNLFSLSSGERAGVRASVKPFITGAFAGLTLEIFDFSPRRFIGGRASLPTRIKSNWVCFEKTDNKIESFG
jgi:hypothetical protein